MSAMKERLMDIEEQILSALEAGLAEEAEIFEYVNLSLEVSRQEVKLTS